MSEQFHSEDSESRKRKLDDLFADEPFLSPTMKARRLHEKLQELQTRDVIDAGGLPSAACVGDISPMLSRTEVNEPVVVQTSEGFVSLTAARRLYRQETVATPREGSDKLTKLKDNLLNKWMEQAWPAG